MIDRVFEIGEETFEIGEKWNNAKKKINTYIVKKNNKFISSLFFFGTVKNEFQVHGWDRLMKDKTKIFYILIYNPVSGEIRSSKVDFPSGRNFESYCKKIIKTLNSKD